MRSSSTLARACLLGRLLGRLLGCLLVAAPLVSSPLPAAAQTSGGTGTVYRAHSSRNRTTSTSRVWRGYRSVELQTPLSRRQTQSRLSGIQREVRQLQRQGQRPVVVFDLDDTIVYHNRSNQLRTIYGSVDYVKALHRAGANIVYLSSRKDSERSSTKAMLTRLGLPLESNEHLLLNNTRLSGAKFKRSAKPRVLAHGRPLAFFDNDYAHVRNYRELYPESRVFRLNTISRRRDQGGTGLIEVINGFFQP